MDETRIVQPILVPDTKNISENWGAYLALRASVISYLRRNEEDQPMWDRWLSGQFTKTVRKYPISKVAEIRELPGALARTTPVNTNCPVFAFPPTTYTEMDPLVRKCQVQGIQYSKVEGAYPTTQAYKTYQTNDMIDIILHVNPHLDMSSGKLFAQVAHAGLLYAILNPEWAASIKGKLKCTDRLLITKSAEIFDKVKTDLFIKDAGYTEVEPGSVTVKIEVLR